MANSRILMIVLGVVALVASFGAAMLVMSVFDGGEPEAIAASEGGGQVAMSSEAVPQVTGAGEDAGRPVRLAQAQTPQRPQGQPKGFPASPGEAASQGGIMTGSGHLKGQYGDWSELCQAASGPGADHCIMVQNIESANRPGFGLATVVRKVPTDNGELTMMHIYVPLGIYLPKGLGLQVDDTLIGNTPFWSCIPFQCEARVTLPPDLIAKLKAGQRALFAVYEDPTKGTVLPISLKGFTEGLAALTPFAPETGQPQ